MNTIRQSCSYKRTVENTEIFCVTSRSTFQATGEHQTASSFYDSFIAALPSWKVNDKLNLFQMRFKEEVRREREHEEGEQAAKDSRKRKHEF